MMDYKDMNAIGIVRLMLTDGVISQEVAEKYFPELAESEDEKIRKELINFFSDKDESDYEGLHPRTEIIAYLEKQGEQKTLEEKADLEKAMANILKVYAHTILCRSLTQDELNKTDAYAIENTKKLLDYFVQRKQLSATWSEEDEIRLKHILRLLDFKDEKKYLLMFGLNSLQDLKKDINWLKSLRPQSQWKPSDEQMELLDSICASNYLTSTNTRVLQKLYDALEKLREE